MNDAMKRWLALLVVCLCTGALQAQSSSTTEKPMVEGLTLSRPSNKKQTGAEEEAGRRLGRELPTPEILQPTLDPSLPAYQPRRDMKLSGRFKGMCSDTMPALVKMWIEGFRKYYPDVKLDVPPPYDGGLGAKELATGNLDFVFISRLLRPDDIADFKAKFGYDAL